MNFLIQDYLDAVALSDPRRAAAQYLDDKLDYEELAIRSNQLAHVLVEHGVERHDRVGIYMDKSINTPVAMYGTMKAGAAYVPLDPAAPAQRIAGVIKDCGIRHLVSADSKLRSLRTLAQMDCELDCVVGVCEQAELPFRSIAWESTRLAEPGHPPVRKIIESDLAYIIYTSGSTGQPKGIMHTHHSGLSFAHWAVNEYGLSPNDRLSNHAPLHFDLSIFDYFAGVVAGASTVVIPEEHTKLPASYTQLLADQKVTVLFTVPFALIQMALRGSVEQRDLRALRWAIFGGEPFPPAYLRTLMRKLPHVRFDNMYGPAEVNGCTHFTVSSIDDEAIPIGPVANCAESLIVDNEDAEVAFGEVGELLVRTPTMMRGYWQRHDLSEQAFYRRKNKIGHDEVFYRTGDLVQELANGILRFAGRKDRQVKVRGYRIEMDEVELALTSVEAVEEAAVYLLEDNEGSNQLSAQVTLRPDAATTANDIIRALKERLPWYAVPTNVSISKEFPRTRAGKIDRRLLRIESQKVLLMHQDRNAMHGE